MRHRILAGTTALVRITPIPTSSGITQQNLLRGLTSQLSKILKKSSLVLLVSMIFSLQSLSAANASWWCWSWFCTPSAESLIEERTYLKKQSQPTKDFFADTIRKYRGLGAPEEDINKYIDNLDKEYQKQGNLHQGGLFKKFSGLLISPAFAGPEFAVCVAPGGNALCAALALIAKQALKKSKDVIIKNSKALTAMIVAMASYNGIAEIENAAALNDIGTKLPKRPKRSSCSCECSVQNKHKDYPGKFRAGWARATGSGKGLKGCALIYEVACEAAKTTLIMSTPKGTIGREDVHHESGKCIDSKGKTFRVEGSKFFETN